MEESTNGSLIDVFGPERVSIRGYYALTFGVLPSGIGTVLPIERKKETLEGILACIDFQHFEFEPCFRYWMTEDNQSAQLSEDYPFEYLFRSTSARMLIHLTSRFDVCWIDFFYDAGMPASEQWALETNHVLRTTFGTPKTPKFKVLVYREGTFGTDNVDTGNFESVEIQEYYNDDFVEIDSIILEAIARKESGIVLLHGEPGTGKTTYIKHLISKFKDHEFIFVQNDFVKDLLKPSFISFLLENKNAILIIEDAEKVVAARDNFTEDSVVSTILQLTDGLFSDFLNIKILCTFNTDIERIDKALLRKGRLIAKYHFKPLAAEKAQALSRKLGREYAGGPMTLAEIFQYDKRDFKDPDKRPLGFVQP